MLDETGAAPEGGHRAEHHRADDRDGNRAFSRILSFLEYLKRQISCLPLAATLDAINIYLKRTKALTWINYRCSGCFLRLWLVN